MLDATGLTHFFGPCEKKMLNCAKCGSTITIGASDCARCGTSVQPEAAVPVQQDSLDPTEGMIGNLWLGNYTLVKTYWLFGILGGLAVALVYVVLLAATKSPVVALLGFLAIWGWQVFISVAIWRSAGKYAGSAIWKVLARLAVVVGVLRLTIETLKLFGGV